MSTVFVELSGNVRAHGKLLDRLSMKTTQEVFKGCTMRISTNGVLCVHRDNHNSTPVKFFPEGTWVGARQE